MKQNTITPQRAFDASKPLGTFQTLKGITLKQPIISYCHITTKIAGIDIPEDSPKAQKFEYKSKKPKELRGDDYVAGAVFKFGSAFLVIPHYRIWNWSTLPDKVSAFKQGGFTSCSDHITVMEDFIKR